MGNLEPARCPRCGDPGDEVGIVTLKSLLLPGALERLEPGGSYRFCANATCETVYFNGAGDAFLTGDLKVPVFQKTQDADCPVCYCFGWTRARIGREIEEAGGSTAISSIAGHVKIGRCACDLNNPQGYCCLGNVKKVLSSRPGWS
ncbi:MAG: (2Fe-2S)-binding protein [Actinobacteria bacterium]|nr:(2Fe-2S)-binding protein [Actinomycetota bacterium]